MKCRPEDYQESFENLVRVCHAIDRQDIALLEQLLAENEYIQCMDDSEDKWLMMCCEPDLFCEFFGLNNLDVPNYVDFLEIPLERAVRTKNIDLVRVIANAGKNLPRWSICLAAALVAAVGMGDKDLVLLLLSAGADPSKSFSEEIPLISAVGRNDIEMVKLLLDKGAFVDPIAADSLITPLLYATMYNRLEIVKILVNAGADVHFISPDSNEGALAKAALRGCHEVYEYLLPLVSNQNEIEFASSLSAKKTGVLTVTKFQ